MNVQKLSMCRVCLVQNVRMFVLANKNLQEIYKKLTDIPLLTENRRPMLACYLCFNRLKQCYQLQRKCLEAEKLFARILNEDYEAKPLLHQVQLEFSGYIISPTEQISISGECPSESGHVINKNIPADCEGQDDKVKLKEEHQSDSEQEFQVLEYLNIYSDREDLLPQLEPGHILLHHSESNTEDEAPLMEFKTEKAEEQEVSKKKRPAKKTSRAPGVKKPKLNSRRAKPEEAVTTQPNKNKQPNSKIIQETHSRTSKPVTEIKTPFNNSNNLIKHIQVYTGENPFKCEVCQCSFSDSSNLRTHVRVHTGENPFKCDVCQRSFSNTSSLRRHMRLHTGEKPFKCDVCQRSFSESNNLRTHMRVHTGEKPYKCGLCKRSYSDSSNFRTHMRVHTGEKPYKCDLCQRSFSESSKLTKHILVHTGELPYKCDACQRGFSQKCSLTRHMNVHTGELPYKCDACQRSFSQKGSLTRHIMRLHIV